MEENEIHSLIKLIDDPDERVFDRIRQELVDRGEDAIPELESAWEEGSFGLLFQQRVETIIHQIQFEQVQKGLREWADEGASDLLQGVLWVNRYQYPELDLGNIHRTIGQLKKDAWIELHEDLTAFETVKVLNHVIYTVHGFRGNKKAPQAPRNHYLNLLLESGDGSPLALGILYLLLARNFQIPIRGVDLPEHFILAYMDEYSVLPQLGQEGNVLFYINPFSKGGIFNQKEIDSFLKQLKKDPDPSYYQPCGNLAIVRRLIDQLKQGYRGNGQTEKVEELEILEQELREEEL
jgi:regulator of sirC expression with transglutaminase-like and TPR domain